MGNIPKYRKPEADFSIGIMVLSLMLVTTASHADSGQAAIKRGNYGAAAAQFMVRAERDDPVAQNNLGVLYLKGRGVPQNYELARSWFEQAASGELAGAMFNLVLVAPEIPHNAGAAGRLCLATGSTLHLIKPLGFSLEDKQVRRAGLNY